MGIEIYKTNGDSLSPLEVEGFKSEGEMEDYIEKNLDAIGEELTILERQFRFPEGKMDFLAVDEKQITVIELKEVETDERILPQVLGYANWVMKNPDSVKYLVSKTKLNESDIDYQNVKISIIAPKIKNSLADITQYVDAFDFNLLEFRKLIDEISGEEYVMTKEVKPRVTKAKPSETYGLDYYERELPNTKFRELRDIVKNIDELVEEEENGLDLRKKFIKNSIRYQYSNRNVLLLDPKKRKKPWLKLALGSDFEPNSLENKELKEIVKEFEQARQDSRHWRVRIQDPNVQKYKGLIEVAYENVKN